jgi:hypothetical protein
MCRLANLAALALYLTALVSNQAARIAGRKMPSKTSARGALSRCGDWRHFALQPVAHSYPPAALFNAARLIF